MKNLKNKTIVNRADLGEIETFLMETFLAKENRHKRFQANVLFDNLIQPAVFFDTNRDIMSLCKRIDEKIDGRTEIKVSIFEI